MAAVRVNIPVRVEASADLLRADASAELVARVAAAVKQSLEFHLFWVRETRGFEGISRGKVTLSEPVKRRGMPLNISEHSYSVPFIVGEDATRILDTAARAPEPVYIFDDVGQVVEAIQPKPGESPRQLVLRLLLEWRNR